MYKISLVFWRMGELGILLSKFTDLCELTCISHYFKKILTFMQSDMPLHRILSIEIAGANWTFMPHFAIFLWQNNFDSFAWFERGWRSGSIRSIVVMNYAVRGRYVLMFIQMLLQFVRTWKPTTAFETRPRIDFIFQS